MLSLISFFRLFLTLIFLLKIAQIKSIQISLRLATFVSIRTDAMVYESMAKSLFPCITSVPNFWNVIYAKVRQSIQ